MSTEFKSDKVTKTVYSWVMPETERLIQEIQSDPEHQEAQRIRERLAWEKKQDAMHVSFGRRWIDWVTKGGVELPLSLRECAFEGAEEPWQFYPTAGSSEAIRESLHELAQFSSYRPYQGPPTIHVFRGEYEGYEALAKPMGIRVVKHERRKWAESLSSWKDAFERGGHVFYLSQPSSLDGNLWGGVDRFYKFCERHNIPVRVDLCYVGCITEPRPVLSRARGSETKRREQEQMRRELLRVPEHVDMVFFSLSKVFGVYYHRIGGVFSRKPMPGLWGNRWFKNLRSLYLGEELMKRHSLYELPNKYRSLQSSVIQDLQREAPYEMTPSDVFLLAHKPRHFTGRTLPGFLREDYHRYCLTPLLDAAAREQGLYEMP